MPVGQINTLRDSSNQATWQIDEGQSMNLEGTLKDGSDVAISKTVLASFSLTLYDSKNKSVINNRIDQSVLDQNGGTVNADGSFIIRLDLLDSVIVDADIKEGLTEEHIARLRWTWNDGTSNRSDSSEWKFKVRRLAAVV